MIDRALPPWPHCRTSVSPSATGWAHLGRPRRGLALLLVLWLVVMLGAITTVAVSSARRAGGVAVNLRARTVARYGAESGVTLAVHTVSGLIAAETDSGTRRATLNALDRIPALEGERQLGTGRWSVAIQDIGALLDVNFASDEQLTRFFAQFVSPSEAEATVVALQRYRTRAPDAPRDGAPIGAGDPALDTRPARPIRSLEELRAVPGVAAALWDRVLPYLTVDGDGTINRRTASDTVRSVAGGEVREEPSRILVTSRGWQAGHPLTWEIQDVYAIQGSMLTFVRRRERLL